MVRKFPAADTPSFRARRSGRRIIPSKLLTKNAARHSLRKKPGDNFSGICSGGAGYGKAALRAGGGGRCLRSKGILQRFGAGEALRRHGQKDEIIKMEVQPVTEELNETRRKQQALLERRMYRLDPAPPKLPAQEYIVRYLTEKGDKYLTWYLHDQEPALNKLGAGRLRTIRYGGAFCGHQAGGGVRYPDRPSKVRSGCRRAVCRFSNAVYGRTVLMIISARRKAVLSP